MASPLAHGQRVLLVGNGYMKKDDFNTALNELVAAVGQGNVALEQQDRLLTVPLKTSHFDVVVSGRVNASIPHTATVCAKLASALKPGARMQLKELVLLSEGSVPAELDELALKTADALVSTLKLSGLVDVQVVGQPQVLDRAALGQVVEHEWQLSADVADLLLGRVAYVEVVAKKPAYEVGAAAALPLRLGSKKKTPAQETKTTTADEARAQKIATWTISANDDDDDDQQELANEDDLLDDEDKVKPAPELMSRPSNCETRKKACKNCSCGRAEMEAMEDAQPSPVTYNDSNAITEVVPKKLQPVSSCGSCFLGDAFRCASCPYLGMPAFKPGEQVLLSGNMMKDDIEV
ncbi:electron carrier [Sorochytrium milnesiophthora]